MQQSTIAVIDASVVFKWHFDDEDCIPQALVMRDDYYFRRVLKALAPQLLTYEMVNGIAVAAKRKRVATDRANEIVSNIQTFGIELIQMQPLRILETALKYDIAAYDAAYLALAEDEECNLWTGDRVLYLAVKGKSPRVKWIGDYKGEPREV